MTNFIVVTSAGGNVATETLTEDPDNPRTYNLNGTVWELQP